MAHIDYDEDLQDAEEKYHESSDEDFNPTTAPADDSSSSSDEADNANVKPAKRTGKRKAPANDELDSGDEITIEVARKRKRKKQKGGQADDEQDLILSDDEGGEGGLIKTRAQRRVEQKERKPLARTEGATVDVDALWAQMSAAPLRPIHPTEEHNRDFFTVEDAAMDGVTAGPSAIEEEEQVMVKKVYTFAGQQTTEEKQVPRSSLDQYLSEGWKPVDDLVDKPAEVEALQKDDKPKIRRPLRRPSRFDPNPTGYVRTLPPEHQLTWPRKRTTAAIPVDQENAPTSEAAKARPEKAQKLNVVDKSRLDWTGFVDKEGIAEELATHGKTKEAYLGRMDFLAGVEARKEEERRKAKTTAAAAAS